MSKFHLNPETGEPGVCKATKQCPFGEAEEHFETQEQVREAFETVQKVLEVMKDKDNRYLDFYGTRDEGEKIARLLAREGKFGLLEVDQSWGITEDYPDEDDFDSEEEYDQACEDHRDNAENGGSDGEYSEEYRLRAYDSQKELIENSDDVDHSQSYHNVNYNGVNDYYLQKGESLIDGGVYSDGNRDYQNDYTTDVEVVIFTPKK